VVRYACLFRPAGASALSPRPLLIFLHGGGIGTADAVYDNTSLRWKAERYDLTGDGRRSFLLLSIQGRNLHYPTHAPRDGHHHDFYYRDLRSPSANPDVANLDRLIDGLVAEGSVDRRRVYLMGWSNGGFFGQMYAIARHATSTPGGNRVAAVVAYTAADPFHNLNPDQVPSCRLDPYPLSTVPIFLLSRSCDIVACDEPQAATFLTHGTVVEPGHVVEPWVRDLATRVGNPNVSRRIVGGAGLAVRVCTPAPLCAPASGLLNHVRWPDGVADGSGIDHEPDMLDFLRAYPLP